MTVEETSELLSVSTGKISQWTTDLRQAQTEEEKVKVIDLWLACETQTEINEKLDISLGKINKIITDFKDDNYENLSEKPPDSRKTFNLWNFSKSSDILKYPGQIPAQIMENLLWYYTEPFDVVYDPI